MGAISRNDEGEVIIAMSMLEEMDTEVNDIGTLLRGWQMISIIWDSRN